MPEQQENKCWYLGCVQVLATPAFIIAQMAGHWLVNETGQVTLWYTCKQNETVCPNLSKCRNTALTGPVWLEMCRTLTCISIFLYFCLFYCTLFWSKLPPPSTFLDHIKTRMSLLLYVIIGILMLCTGIVYSVNYEDYYITVGYVTDKNTSTGLVVSYVGGITSLLNSFLLAVVYDTGFIAYMKGRIGNSSSCCSRGGTAQQPSSQRRGRSVKDRCCGFITCIFNNNNNDNDNNNNNNNRTPNSGNGSGSGNRPSRIQPTATTRTCPVHRNRRNQNDENGTNNANADVMGSPPSYSSIAVISDRFILVELPPSQPPPSYEEATRDASRC